MTTRTLLYPLALLTTLACSDIDIDVGEDGTTGDPDQTTTVAGDGDGDPTTGDGDGDGCPTCPTCEPDPLQHAPCSPFESDCGDGHCVAYVGPTMTWVCETEEPGQPDGSPCDRHEECDSGVCLLATLNPFADPQADYGACAKPCSPASPAPECGATGQCSPVGSPLEGGEQPMICLLAD